MHMGFLSMPHIRALLRPPRSTFRSLFFIGSPQFAQLNSSNTSQNMRAQSMPAPLRPSDAGSDVPRLSSNDVIWRHWCSSTALSASHCCSATADNGPETASGGLTTGYLARPRFNCWCRRIDVSQSGQSRPTGDAHHATGWYQGRHFVSFWGCSCTLKVKFCIPSPDFAPSFFFYPKASKNRWKQHSFIIKDNMTLSNRKTSVHWHGNMTHKIMWQIRHIAIELNLLCKLYFRSSDRQSEVMIVNSKITRHLQLFGPISFSFFFIFSKKKSNFSKMSNWCISTYLKQVWCRHLRGLSYREYLGGPPPPPPRGAG